jgi:hypothetical protein
VINWKSAKASSEAATPINKAKANGNKRGRAHGASLLPGARPGGIIYSMVERGMGEDAGRLRLTFRYRARAWRQCHRNGVRAGGPAGRLPAWISSPTADIASRPPIIQHAIWLYLRFTLSHRDVEELLAERGLEVSYETVRRWILKFGPGFADGFDGPAHARAIDGTSTRWWSGLLANGCTCGAPSITRASASVRLDIWIAAARADDVFRPTMLAKIELRSRN